MPIVEPPPFLGTTVCVSSTSPTRQVHDCPGRLAVTSAQTRREPGEVNTPARAGLDLGAAQVPRGADVRRPLLPALGLGVEVPDALGRCLRFDFDMDGHGGQ